MTAAVTVTVASELINKAVSATAPPASVSDAVQNLLAKRDQLDSALTQRDSHRRVTKANVRRAVVTLRDTWQSLRGWIASRLRLPSISADERAMLLTVTEAFFGSEGLVWTTARRAEVWAASSRRLALSDSDGHTPRLEALGARDVIAAVRAAHADFGDALGVTEPTGTLRVPVVRAVREAREAVKLYVACVGGMAALGDPASAEEAARRLIPLSTLERPARKRQKEEEPAPAEPVPAK